MVRIRIALALFLGLASLPAPPVHGDVIQSGSVVINPGTNPTIYVGGAPNMPGDGTLRVTPPSTLAAGTIQIAASFSNSQFSGLLVADGGAINAEGSINVGSGGYGQLQAVNAGVVMATNISIGAEGQSPVGSRGVALVDGAGSQLRYTSSLRVGDYNDGELNIRNGGAVVPASSNASSTIVSGTPTASGLLSVDGPGSRFQFNNQLSVGGAGTIQITGGGAVAGQLLSLGADQNFPSGGARVVIDGPNSRLSLTRLDLGGGDVRVTGGGILDVPSTPGTTSGFTVIGANQRCARLTIDGPDSQWIGTSRVALGSGGTGEMYLQNGANVTTGVSTIGETGSGLAVVRGERTRWQLNGLQIAPRAAVGELRIEQGATVSLLPSGPIVVGMYGNLTLADGNLTSVIPTKLDNSGVISGSGLIGADVTNTNAGRIELGPGDHLHIAGNLVQLSRGMTEVSGGELEVDGNVTALPGNRLVADDATIRVRGLPKFVSATSLFTNSGQAQFVGGANRVYGNVINTGSLDVSGNSRVTFYDRVTNGGGMSIDEGSSITVLGDYSGNGAAGGGKATLEGAIRPAHYADSSITLGAMQFGGDVSLGGASSLALQIAGSDPITGFDSLSAEGRVLLSGALSLEAVTPLSAPLTIPIITAGELVGAFSSAPALGANLGFGVKFAGLQYDYQKDRVLASFLPGNPADMNYDGAVDGADILAWQLEGADVAAANAGLAAWSAHFSTASVTNAAAVPEPGAENLLRLGVGLLFILARRRF